MDLIEQYSNKPKISIRIGQKCKFFYEKNGEEYYRCGMVVGIYDTHFEVQTEAHHSLIKYDEPEEMKKIQLLTVDGEPAMCKKNIFGKYKLTR